MHEIKPNLAILNEIKRKYELIIKNNNNNTFQIQNIKDKIEEIDNISKQKLSEDKDNIYFEKEFDQKALLNTFLFFTQKMHYTKNKETPYSKKYPANDIISGLYNINDIKGNNGDSSNDNSAKNTTYNGNINSPSENRKDLKSNISNSITEKGLNINITNNPNNNNKNNIQLNYLNFLEKAKANLETSFNNIFMKEFIKFNDIIDVLFLNENYAKILYFNSGESEKDIIKFIDKFIEENKNIKNIEFEKLFDVINIEDTYHLIKSNKFLINTENIINTLKEERKYRKLMEKLNNKNNVDRKAIESIYDELKLKIINYGGFDKHIANLVIETIDNYLINKRHISFIDNSFKELSEISNEYFDIIIEINQLRELKEKIMEYSNNIKNNNTNLGINELENIKTNFDNKYIKYLENTNDKEFSQALEEINNFVNKNNMNELLNLIKKDFTNVQLKFYSDDSINLLSYCWGNTKWS